MKVQVLPHADRQLKKLSRHLQALLIKEMIALADDPHPINAKKLTHKDAWRLKIKNHRMIYQVNKKTKTVTILFIAHRRDIYRLFN